MKYFLDVRYSVFLFFVGFSSVVSAQGKLATLLENSILARTEKSIVGTAATSEDYRILSAIIKASGLEDLLDGSVPFTVFAPSDIAFKHFRGESIADLLKSENTEELKSLLGYHIVAGKLSASNILKALCEGRGTATFTTVQGDLITATMKGIDIILNDSYGNTATIIVADANQNNGIIHQIDGVILPKKS